jgi:hypothetical protein
MRHTGERTSLSRLPDARGALIGTAPGDSGHGTFVPMFGRPGQEGRPMMGTVVSGCAEPAGERFSQRERGGIGVFVDGCGPGDVGVWADQKGAGWL